MHALCNEIGPFGVGLPTLGLKPDIIAGVVRHYVRDAIENRGYEHQCQERPNFLHGSLSVVLFNYQNKTPPTGQGVLLLIGTKDRGPPSVRFRYCSMGPVAKHFHTFVLAFRLRTQRRSDGTLLFSTFPRGR
jgi:hypothetical protein